METVSDCRLRVLTNFSVMLAVFVSSHFLDTYKRKFILSIYPKFYTKFDSASPGYVKFTFHPQNFIIASFSPSSRSPLISVFFTSLPNKGGKKGFICQFRHVIRDAKYVPEVLSDNQNEIFIQAGKSQVMTQFMADLESKRQTTRKCKVL